MPSYIHGHSSPTLDVFSPIHIHHYAWHTPGVGVWRVATSPSARDRRGLRIMSKATCSHPHTREVKDTRYRPAVLSRPSIPNAETLENVNDNAEVPTGKPPPFFFQTPGSLSFEQCDDPRNLLLGGYYWLAFKLRRRKLSKVIGDNA